MRITKNQQIEQLKKNLNEAQYANEQYNDLIKKCLEITKTIPLPPGQPNFGPSLLDAMKWLADYFKQNQHGINIQVAMLSQELSRVWYLLRAITQDETLKAEPQPPLINPFPRAGF